MSRKFWDYWRKFSLSGKVVEPLRALRLSFHLYSFSCIVNTPFLPSHTLSLLLALPVDFILVFFLARQYPRGTRVRYILLLMIVVSISVIHGMVDSWCDGLRPVCVGFNVRKKGRKKRLTMDTPAMWFGLVLRSQGLPRLGKLQSPVACIAENNILAADPYLSFLPHIRFLLLTPTLSTFRLASTVTWKWLSGFYTFSCNSLGVWRLRML